MRSFNDAEKVHRNLYKYDGKYYRLFAMGVTPNNCWLIAPILKELVDIDAGTGADVYGSDCIEFDVTGTVSQHNEFVRTF